MHVKRFRSVSFVVQSTFRGPVVVDDVDISSDASLSTIRTKLIVMIIKFAFFPVDKTFKSSDAIVCSSPDVHKSIFAVKYVPDRRLRSMTERLIIGGAQDIRLK